MGLFSKIAKTVIISKNDSSNPQKVQKIAKVFKDDIHDVYNKSNDNYVTKLHNSNPDKYLVIVKRDYDSHGTAYKICDEESHVIYKAEMSLSPIKKGVDVLNLYGEKIASIAVKRLSIRSPFSVENDPIDLSFTINENKICNMKSQSALGKRKYVLDSYNWSIESTDSLRSKFTVRDDNKIPIIEIPNAIMSHGCYTMIVNEKNDLLLGILILFGILLDKGYR